MKICAFMSVYNEEDIIEETISKLIENGIEVFILDNGCTDNTISKIQKYVGKGIVDIYHYITLEDGKKVFKLYDILNEFEKISKILPHDWFMISDADEIKYSPWHDSTLNDGIARVDNMGFNLIQFKLFDFRPTEPNINHDEFEKNMPYYSMPEFSSIIQMKCWKRSEYIDLKTYGGHIISVPNPRLFPVKFINKHYPIRSSEHGVQKLLRDRLDRYSPIELKQGWHTHYSNIDPTKPDTINWKIENLFNFDLNLERYKILEDATELMMDIGLITSKISNNALENIVSSYIEINYNLSADHAKKIYNAGKIIYEMSEKNQLPPIDVANGDMRCIQMVISSLRFIDSLNGNLLRVRNSEKIKLNIA